jgi:deazaflavin-dependent oxidoreductase (nitroreductase family)
VRLDNRVVSAVLRSRAHRVLSRSALLLRYRGRRSGRVYTVPVQYVERDGELLLFAMGAERKQWWRNLHGAEVEVLLRGTWRHASARVVRGDAELARRYRERFRWAARQLERDPIPVFVVLALSEPPGGSGPGSV